MRPRYYLPKQEFRTRGEIMESSAASFVVKIGGRLLPETLLYLRGGALEEEGGEEEEGWKRSSVSSRFERRIRGTKNIGSRKFFSFRFLRIGHCFLTLFSSRKMKNKWQLRIFFSLNARRKLERMDNLFFDNITELNER